MIFSMPSRASSTAMRAVSLRIDADVPEDATAAESAEIVRMEHGLIISRTHHGFVCANAGVDASNVGAEEVVTLLPEDPDRSALGLRHAVLEELGVDVGVVVFTDADMATPPDQIPLLEKTTAMSDLIDTAVQTLRQIATELVGAEEMPGAARRQHTLTECGYIRIRHW